MNPDPVRETLPPGPYWVSRFVDKYEVHDKFGSEIKDIEVISKVMHAGYEYLTRPAPTSNPDAKELIKWLQNNLGQYTDMQDGECAIELGKALAAKFSGATPAVAGQVGCKCDPPGSGEEYCNGYCYITSQSVLEPLEVNAVNHVIWEIDEKVSLEYRMKCAEAICAKFGQRKDNLERRVKEGEKDARRKR